MLGLFVLGLVIGVAGFLGTGEIASEVERQAFDEQAALADTEARNFESWQQSNLLVTEALSNQEAIVDGDPSSSYLSQQAESYSGGHHIHFVDDEAGVVMSSSDEEFEGASFDEIDAPWTELGTFEEMASAEYREARFAGVYTADDGVEVAAYVKPVETPGGAFGDFEGVLVYTVSLQTLGNDLINEDGRITYIVADGQVVADPTGSSVFEGYGHSEIFEGPSGSATLGSVSDSLEQSLVRGVAHQSAEFHREAYIASYAQITDEDGWYAVVHTPEEQAFGFAYTIQEYGTYLSIAGTLFIVLVGGLIARSTSRSLNNLENQAKQIGQGNLEVELETERIDSIGQLYDEFGKMRDSLKRQIQEAQEARETAERARAETEQVNAELEAKADEYRGVMQVCAQGDLTARLDPTTENESMREIGEEFNQMIDEIEQTVAQLKAFSSEVATRSEQVTASAEEVRSASEQVTGSVQEISDGADRQNESLQSVTHEINGLSTTTEQIAASSNEVADIAERTAETGRSGREAAQQAIAGMNQIETESEAAVEEIERLEAEMGQIDELLTFITEVAEQTNMLALNANIEAARSGSSGEGFSVVASEVKELAEETKDAAEDIERRLEQIKTQTERTAEEVQATSQHVTENKESVESAVEALDEIAEYATETNDGVQEISAASQQQAASTQEVVAMVDEAATIAEQTSVESENVAAAAEEQTSSLTEVSESANDLANRSVGLSEALDRFDTDADVGDGLEDDGLDGETAILSEGDSLIDALQADEFGADTGSESLEGFTYDEAPAAEADDVAEGPFAAEADDDPADGDEASSPDEQDGVDETTDPLAALSGDADEEPIALGSGEDDEDVEPFAVGDEEAAADADDDPLAALDAEGDVDEPAASEAVDGVDSSPDADGSEELFGFESDDSGTESDAGEADSFAAEFEEGSAWEVAHDADTDDSTWEETHDADDDAADPPWNVSHDVDDDADDPPWDVSHDAGVTAEDGDEDADGTDDEDEAASETDAADDDADESESETVDDAEEGGEDEPADDEDGKDERSTADDEDGGNDEVTDDDVFSFGDSR